MMGTNTGAASWNASLIGLPEGRRRLDTPALIVDLSALHHNIEFMARFATDSSVALRPHVKTHKSIEIARRQVAAGAIGVSCATLGEAEIMVAGGIPGVLITSPMVTESKITRLIALARQAGPSQLMMVVDQLDNAKQLATAALDLPHPLTVLIDYCAGYGRTGVGDAYQALELARYIADQPCFELAGLQAYAGNLQHLLNIDERTARTKQLHEQITHLVFEIGKEGIRIPIITGAGTGTYELDARSKVFTELQVGSYVFMDVEYMKVLETGGRTCPLRVALFVQTAVVSHPASQGWVTVDGGTKCFSTDGGMPVASKRECQDNLYAFFGDEHGKLLVSGRKPEVGARIEFITPHCDPTVNLHDVFHVVNGETLVAIWPIDARGKR